MFFVAIAKPFVMRIRESLKVFHHYKKAAFGPGGGRFQKGSGSPSSRWEPNDIDGKHHRRLMNVKLVTTVILV